MRYKISKSLNGDTTIWIARLKKTVVSRAKSNDELLKALAKRDKTIKASKKALTSKKTIKKKSLASRFKAASEAFDETEEVVVTKKASPKRPGPKKRKRLTNKLAKKVQKRKRTLEAQTKTPKKGFWGKSA